MLRLRSTNFTRAELAQCKYEQQIAATCLATMLRCNTRITISALATFARNKFRVASCGTEMLRRVEVTSTCRGVLRQLATWKCVARQVARNW